MTVGRRLAGTALLCVSLVAVGAELVPGRWSADERAEFQQREFYFFPPYRGTVQGGSILVTGTASPIAVHAGVEALRKGGSAADAAATVALTQITTNLGAVISFAGISQLVYFDAKTRKVYALDAGWQSYTDERDPASIPPTDVRTDNNQPLPPGAGVGDLGRQTLVGGFVAGLDAMHAKFGRLKFAELFQSSIWYAENGVTISPSLANWLRQRQPQLWRTPEGRRFASMPDGSLPKVGDLLRQPDLARTLKAVASQGAAYMYTGEWARNFVAAVRADGGKATVADLASYKPAWRDSLSTEFNGATVHGPGEDSGKTCPTLETLNLLAGLKVETLGPYWRDPLAFKAYVHSLRFALYGHYVPRVAAFETAQGFNPDCKSRLSPQYAAKVSPQIASLLGAPAAQRQGGHDTESVIVVDRWGNVAALVHSINTVLWGDTGIVVGGIPIADAAAINIDYLRSAKSGTMVPNGMSPVIALRNGKPVLAVASAGSSLTPETARLVGGVLAGYPDLPALMGAPPLVLNPAPFVQNQSLFARPELIPAGAYDAKFLQSVAAAGVAVREEPVQTAVSGRGTAVMVVIDRPSGAPRAVEVPSVAGFAESDRQRGVSMPTVIAAAPQVLDRYVGSYRSAVSPNPVTRVVRDGNRLITRTGSQREEWFPDSTVHFFSKVADAELSFRPGNGGKPSEMVLRRGYNELILPRFEEAEATPAPTPAAPAPVTLPPSSASVVDATGDWKGALGPNARVAFHIRKDAQGNLQATFDSPDAGSFGTPVTRVTVVGEQLTIGNTAGTGASFEGRWDTAGSQWIGQWRLTGVTTPLTLTRGVFQSAARIEGLDGDWDGVFGANRSSLNFHIETGPLGTFGRVGLPSQRVGGALISSIARRGNHIVIAVVAMGATIEADLSANGKTLTGMFTAFGATRPLTMNRQMPNK